MGVAALVVVAAAGAAQSGGRTVALTAIVATSPVGTITVPVGTVDGAALLVAAEAERLEEDHLKDLHILGRLERDRPPFQQDGTSIFERKMAASFSFRRSPQPREWADGLLHLNSELR